MDLYDIHTHDSPSPNADDEVPRRQPVIIQDVFPLGFEYARDSKAIQWFSCGVHPWYSEDAAPQLKFLSEIASDPQIVAIGETGLDKLKGPSLEIQKKVFEQQILLSEQLGKPLITHCVKAWDAMFEIKKRLTPKQVWITHGYRGKPELTRRLLNEGFMFSIGEKFNEDSLYLIPLDRLFCETDDSDIPIEEIYDKVAETLGVPVEVLAEQIEKNVHRIFFPEIPIQ